MKRYEIITLGVAAFSFVAGCLVLSNLPAPAQVSGQPFQGASGPTGATPNFSIGTVTGVPYGTAPSMTITGTPTNPVLNVNMETGQTGLQGVQGNAGATGATGSSGITCYNASGSISACKIWVGSAIVNSSGVWSADISAAAFTSIKSAQFGFQSLANSGLGAISAASCSSTACSGTASGALNVLGVLILSLNNISGSVVSLQVLGN